MNFYQIVTLAIVLLSSLIIQVTAGGCKCEQYVVIEHGDRCSYVYGFDENKDFYVRYKDLIIFNPTLDCSNLRTGDKLCVECDIQKSAQTYIIKKGDTCESLAKKFKTTVNNLEDLNMNSLSCDDIDYQIGNEMYYYASGGDYTPDFSNAVQVYIPSSSKN